MKLSSLFLASVIQHVSALNLGENYNHPIEGTAIKALFFLPTPDKM